MNRLRRHVSWATLAAVVACAASCGDSASPPVVASVVIAPDSATVFVGASTQLNALLRDSRGNSINGRSVAWSTLDQTTATVSAGGMVTGLRPGRAIIAATSGSASGSASVTVLNAPPTVATSAAATPSPVTGTTAALSVSGADDGGEPALTYTWAATGTPPAAVSFAPNGTNAAKASTATFSKAGTYTLQATLTDAQGLVITSSLTVIVNQTPTSIVVTPASATVTVGGTQAFAATTQDQFAQPLSVAPAFIWAVSGGGTIDASGLFTAGSTAGGPFTVTATSGGRTGTAVVLVIPALDYAIVDAQFTQAIQSADGSISTVLGGNGAAVNVLMSSTAAGVVPMQLVLRLFDAAGNLVRADTVQVNATPGAAPGYATPSAQFLLPPAALASGMRWQVVRDPRYLALDDTPANDVFPRFGPAPLTMVAVPPLRVRFVPIVLTAHGNATGAVSAATIPEYVRMLESVYPLATIEASVSASFSTAVSFGTPPVGGDGVLFWLPVLAQLDLARVMDPDPTTHWVGVVLPPPGFTSITNGGFGYIPSSGTSSGAGTRTVLVTSLGWANNPAFTRGTVAHELGHNFGRRHASCGNATNVDPLYPYAGGLIGLPGHDVRGWMAGRSLTAVTLPATSGEIMSYCYTWVSDYTYRGVLAFRGTVAAMRSAEVRALAEQPVRVLVVRGTVVEGREVTLAPAFTLDARPTRPELDGSYRLEGRADDGRVLFAYTFAPAATDHAPDIGHFTFAIPVTPDIETALATIEVRGPAGVARVDHSGVPAMLRAAASVEPQRVADGLVSFACADADARGILVRDANSGALLGTASASSVRVAATAGTPLTIVCSDGIRSSAARVIAP